MDYLRPQSRQFPGHSRMLSAEKDYTPIILLDEITAHLDVKKREALFEEILKTGAQSWLTGTDLDLFSTLTKK